MKKLTHLIICISALLFFKCAIADNDFTLTNNLTSGSACVGEAITYKRDAYDEYIKKIKLTKKYRDLPQDMVYTLLSPNYSSAFIATVGCSDEKIVISINDEPHIFQTKDGYEWSKLKQKIYHPMEKEYPAKIFISKINNLKSIKLKSISGDYHPTIDHELLKVKIQYKNKIKIMYGVSIISFDWFDEIPEWFKKELKDTEIK